jgi:large subunit ribosomal protein L4
MPKVDLYNMQGEVTGEIELNDNIFGIEVNKNAIHLAILSQLANRRHGTSSTKTKSEVRGGGRKPWRQKGTGRARQGSIRSAQWVGGGVALGPKPRNYKYKLPRKLKKIALKSALSSKAISNDIIVLDDLNFEKIKTKNMLEVINNLKITESTVLIILPGRDVTVQKSARNLRGIKTVLTNTINVFDILKYNKFLITKDALTKVEEVYA